MRTAIILIKADDGRVSVSHYENPLEAKAVFKGLPQFVYAELWTSSAGRVKIRKKVGTGSVTTPQPVTVQPQTENKPAAAYQRKGR